MMDKLCRVPLAPNCTSRRAMGSFPLGTNRAGGIEE